MNATIKNLAFQKLRFINSKFSTDCRNIHQRIHVLIKIFLPIESQYNLHSHGRAYGKGRRIIKFTALLKIRSIFIYFCFYLQSGVFRTCSIYWTALSKLRCCCSNVPIIFNFLNQSKFVNKSSKPAIVRIHFVSKL